jgi:hypothetical protein
MTIEKIKTKMLEHKDYYGGKLLDYNDIEKANSKKELNEILNSHRTHMEDMLCDANSSLNSFQRELGLHMLP